MPVTGCRARRDRLRERDSGPAIRALRVLRRRWSRTILGEQSNSGSSVGVLVAVTWFATGPVVALDVVGLLFRPFASAEEAGNHGCLSSCLGYLAGQESVRFARASLKRTSRRETASSVAVTSSRYRGRSTSEQIDSAPDSATGQTRLVRDARLSNGWPDGSVRCCPVACPMVDQRFPNKRPMLSDGSSRSSLTSRCPMAIAPNPVDSQPQTARSDTCEADDRRQCSLLSRPRPSPRSVSARERSA